MKKQLVLKKSVIAVMLTFGATEVALAQATAKAPVQSVYVTGSNLKRADKEGSSPVEVITAKQIADTGANTVQELLKHIPAFGAGASVDVTDGGFSRGASTASLRGLGSSGTLILLNGRRITAAAYADPNQGKSTVYDLNQIPTSALARVELLKDGASAVYGSDAIAGVVNFITKKDYSGAELSAYVSANDDGEFARRGVSGIWGMGDLDQDRYNLFMTVDLSKRDRTAIADVNDIQKDIYAAVNGRLNPLFSSLTASPFFYRERTPGARNFANTLALSNDVKNLLNCPTSEQLTGNAGAHNLAATSALIGRTFCNFNGHPFSEAQGASEDASLLSILNFKLSPSITSFTEVGYTRQERAYTSAPRAIQSTSGTTVFRLNGAPETFQIILPVGHPDNPFPTSRSAVGFRTVNGTAGSANINETFRFLTGLKGTAGTWDWEAAYLFNKSERTEKWYGLHYKPTLARIMTENRTIAATIADPTSTANTVNVGEAEISQFDARATTTIGKLAGGDVGLAIGGEIRNEKIKLTPDEKTQRGDIVGLANSAINGSRSVKSAFAEVNMPFTKSFEMNVAARYDKYPTVSSLVPKVGAKWTLNDRLTMRGSLGRGFMAPALMQVSAGGVQSFTTVTDPLRCPDGVNPVAGADRTDCAKGVSSLSAGTPDLKSERSKSLSAGLIFNATKNFDVLVDYWNIEKRDEAALLSAQFVLDHQDRYPGRVIRDTNPANLLVDSAGRQIPNSGPVSAINRAWVNQGSTKTSGFDFEAALRTNLGEHGSLSSRLAWSYTATYERAERPGDTPHNAAGTSGGISDWATSVDNIPRHRTNASISWTKADHSVSASVNHVSAVSLLRRYDSDVVYPVPYCHYGTGQPSTAYQLGGLPKFTAWTDGRCEIRSWTTVGLSYNYSGFKNVRLGFNIQNLFDTPAPYSPGSGTTGYNTGLHNGYGRYFRVSANYQFK